MKIGIMGMGFVGGTAAKVLGDAHEILPYDKYKPEYNDPSVLREAELVFNCVPTPMKKSGGMDYQFLDESLGLLEKITCTSGKPHSSRPLVVIRSTTVPGTTDYLNVKYPFSFAFNPEFLREKHALEDMRNPDRIIIGANTEEDFQKIKSVYFPLFPGVPYEHVSPKEAEMTKYASNAMLAMQVMAANEIKRICDSLEIDYDAVKRMLLYDPRIARNIDVPGPDGKLGFGGKCFPKDVNALIHLARENGYRPHILEEMWRSNLDLRKEHDWEHINGATSEKGFS